MKVIHSPMKPLREESRFNQVPILWVAHCHGVE